METQDRVKEWRGLSRVFTKERRNTLCLFIFCIDSTVVDFFLIVINLSNSGHSERLD